ncbi:hypothetical protein Gasu2_34850 [Galdieria sulphuraria]|nr:hypothetical protein Gasu2_34850 [Galdieria sulphuraria]
MSLNEPLIDRKEDIYSILRTYYYQFPRVGGNLNTPRPAACFSPQVFGAGKSCVGENFLEFLKKFADEEEEQTKTEVFNKSSSGKVDLKIFSWKHFAENTLSVVLELEDGFSDAPFPRFLQALLYNIILNAYRQNGRRKDAAHVASMIIRELNLDDAIDYLLEQFQKRYLFLMIDELSHLSYLTKYYSELTTKQFVESDPKYVPFRNFFRILRDLLITGKLIVYLAGRTAEISAPLSDARSSSVSLHMLRLNPFNLHDINEYIELATYDGKSLKDWLLPSDGIRHRFF